MAKYKTWVGTNTMRINHATMNRAMTWWINENLTPYDYQQSVVSAVRYDDEVEEFIVKFAPATDVPSRDKK